MSIIVKSQEELDRIPCDCEERIYIKFGTCARPAVVKSKYTYPVVARDNSSVVAWNNSSVEAFNNSSVEAFNNSFVEAFNNSFVVARDNSSVVAK